MNFSYHRIKSSILFSILFKRKGLFCRNTSDILSIVIILLSIFLFHYKLSHNKYTIHNFDLLAFNFSFLFHELWLCQWITKPLNWRNNASNDINCTAKIEIEITRVNPGGVENLRLAKTCLKPGLRSPQSDLSGVWRRDHTSCAVLIIVQPIRGQTQSWASNCNRLGAELRSVGVWEPRVTITLNRDQSYSQGQSVGAWLATGHWGMLLLVLASSHWPSS